MSAEPTYADKARVILDDPSGEKFAAYLAFLRSLSPTEVTQEMAREVLRDVANGHHWGDAA